MTALKEGKAREVAKNMQDVHISNLEISNEDTSSGTSELG